MWKWAAAKQLYSQQTKQLTQALHVWIAKFKHTFDSLSFHKLTNPEQQISLREIFDSMQILIFFRHNKEREKRNNETKTKTKTQNIIIDLNTNNLI